MKRLSSKLSYANVVATLALFLVLGGGTAIAANQLAKNSVGGKQIKKEAVTGAKIKNGTITGGKIAAGAITGSNLDLSSLGTVPTAGHANTADSANTANSANTAGNAQALQGMSPAQISAEAKLSCPAGMVKAVGVCFESGPRTSASYITALTTCANAGMVVPSFNDLTSFDIVTGNESTPEWAGQIYYDGTELRAEIIYGAGSSAVSYVETEPYRCAVPPSN